MSAGARAALVAFVALVFAEAGAAPGDGRLHAKGRLYLDDDDTQIVSTLAEAEVALPGSTRAGGHALVDVVSAASVDVISAATPRFDEVRLELGGRAGIDLTPDLAVELSFTYSGENDWRSLGPGASMGLDLAQRNTRVEASYVFVHNLVGRTSDPSFERSLITHNASVGISQLIDDRTSAGLSYEISLADGWLSSPYRYVRLGGNAGAFLERHPNTRLRHSVTLHGLRSLAEWLAAFASYRIYADDWGLLSHTALAELRFALSADWTARLRARGYHQRAVEFWRSSYTEPREHMSADRELSTFWDLGFGAKLAWEPEPFVIDVKLEGQYFRFLDYAPLPERYVLMSEVGAGVVW